MKLIILILLLCLNVIAIPKKQILLGTKKDENSNIKLTFDQSDIQQDEYKNQFNTEITNKISDKSILIGQLQDFQNYFEILLSKQQQIGIFLVFLICFIFFLKIKLEDRKMKDKEQNNMIQKQKQEQNIVILTDSIFEKEQSNQPLISTIIGSTFYEERHFRNKSADNAINKQQIPILQRSNSQPFLKLLHPDYTAEEIHNLLHDIN